VCNPVALGVASFGSSALGAIGSHQQAQAQAAAQNKAISRRKNQENRRYELETLQGTAQYNTDKIDLIQQQNQIGLEFQEFRANEDMEIDDAINQYLAVDREAQIKLMGAEKANEGGRARTYNRNPANEIRRARAAAQANLGRRVIAGKINKDRARNQANRQRQKLYLGMANPYRPGPAPSQEVEYVKGPSTLGLVAGLAGAAVQGASTYNTFAPEGQKIGE